MIRTLEVAPVERIQLATRRQRGRTGRRGSGQGCLEGCERRARQQASRFKWPIRRVFYLAPALPGNSHGKEVAAWTCASVDIRNGNTARGANAARRAAAANTSSRRFASRALMRNCREQDRRWSPIVSRARPTRGTGSTGNAATARVRPSMSGRSPELTTRSPAEGVAHSWQQPCGTPGHRG